MSISVRCTGCGSTLKVVDSHAGKKGKCPKCGGTIQVPSVAECGGSTTALRGERPSSATMRAATPAAAIPVSVASRHRHSDPPALAWIVPCIGIVAVLCIWIYILATSGSVPEYASPSSTDAGVAGPPPQTTPSRQPAPPKPPEAARPTAPNVDAGPDDSSSFTVSAGRMQKLFDAATAFRWKPERRQDYDVLAGLAMQMTLCKQAGAPPSLGKLADKFFAEIQAVEWNAERIEAIQSYVPGQVTKVNHGIVFVGSATRKGKNKAGEEIALFFEVPNLRDLLIAAMPKEDVAGTARGARLLVFGVVLQRTRSVSSSDGSGPKTARFVQSSYSMPIP